MSLPGEHGHDEEMELNEDELEEEDDDFNDRIENIIANGTRRDKRRRVVPV